MDLYEKLLEQRNKTFPVEELKLLSKVNDYNKFAEIICSLVAENKLAPVKASGTNGKKTNTLYNKYKLLLPQEDYSDIIEEIKLLSSEFNHQAYLDKPKEFVKYRIEIKALDEFFKKRKNELQVPVSINERSFQIWGREKLLKDENVIQRIFAFNNLALEMLNFYETPEPFFEYIHNYEHHMDILIIENKDTWYSMRKFMKDKNGFKFVNNYNALLYGEGKKVIRNNNMLSYYDREIMKGCSNTYHYFGDLDYEGIGIFLNLKKLYPDLNIALEVKFYELMLNICEPGKLPYTKDGQVEFDISDFLEEFDSEHQAKIIDILGSGRYIPQEIINYKVLNEIISWKA
jgi:hypothetical protein